MHIWSLWSFVLRLVFLRYGEALHSWIREPSRQARSFLQEEREQFNILRAAS